MGRVLVDSNVLLDVMTEDERWLEWLGNVTITYTEQGESVLVGTIADQSALYGLVAKLRDLGLPLVSVNPLDEADQGAALL